MFRTESVVSNFELMLGMVFDGISPGGGAFN